MGSCPTLLWWWVLLLFTASICLPFILLGSVWRNNISIHIHSLSPPFFFLSFFLSFFIRLSKQQHPSHDEPVQERTGVQSPEQVQHYQLFNRKGSYSTVILEFIELHRWNVFHSNIRNWWQHLVSNFILIWQTSPFHLIFARKCRLTLHNEH